MKNIEFNWNTIWKHLRSASRFGVAAGMALLISFLYPGNGRFKYEFQKGQTWRYETLAAPFEFAIKKPDAEVRANRLQTEQGFAPYYRLNEELPPHKISGFTAAVEQKQSAGELPPDAAKKYRDFGKRLLQNLYQQGIITLAPEHRERGKDFVLHVVSSDNRLYRRTLPGFFSLAQAMSLAQDSLRDLEPKAPNWLLAALQDAIAPNLSLDEALNKKMLDDALAYVLETRGKVRQGEPIVSKGDVVTEEVFQKLLSFREKFQQDVASGKSGPTVWLGYLLLTLLLLGVFMLYIHAYRKEILTDWQSLSFVLTWFLAFSYLTWLVGRSNALSVYVIPFCIVPMVVRHFFTYRLAFFTHVVVVLIAGLLTSSGFQFVFIQIVAGVVAVLAIADARNWTRFFTSVLTIFLTYSLAYLGLTLVEEGQFNRLVWQSLGWFLLNGLLSLMAFPLIPLVERVFGFTSSISLVELSDMNRPLLRELAMKAPGTLQHSLQVGNLAEAAAHALDADALLVRVGALYHDIGKTIQPEYFIENQSNSNPHESLNRLDSARIIIEHVTEGAALAKKNRLPEVIIRFILTHHGTTKTDYFYKNYVKENPGKKVDEAAFTYPGPKPSSKEEAILMIADTVEATARSMKNPSGKDLDVLVDRAIADKMEKGQFSESKITLGDLERCRVVFKRMLKSIHHVRIEYPE